MVKIICGLVFVLIVFLCATIETKRGKGLPVGSSLTYVSVDSTALNFKQLVYVPINTDFMRKQGLKKEPTTVLKVRNISPSDSLFVIRIDYLGKEGQTLKQFLDSAVLIKPMTTTEIVIRNGDLDHAGDNFLVEWGANNPKHFPLIQAISFGHDNRYLLTEDGIVIKESLDAISN